MIINNTCPQVSVIIPTYNRSWGLTRAVRSVLEQSFEDFELIIVDDNSPDDTEEVAQSFSDLRIHYFRQPQNVGIVNNLETGLQIASGEFVTFLMDDDFYQKDFLENHIKYLAPDLSLSVVFSSYTHCDLDENPINQNIPPFKDKMLLSSSNLLKAILDQYWFIGASMYRRSSALAVWDMAKNDKSVIDYSIAIYLAINGSQGMYIHTLDCFVSCHAEQVGQAKKQEMLYQTQKTLDRIVSEPQASRYTHLINRTRSHLKLIQARSLDLTLKDHRLEAFKIILEALKTDFSNLQIWKQLSKLLVFKTL